MVLGCGWWRCVIREWHSSLVVSRWVWVVGLRLCARGKSHCKCGVKVALVEVLRTRRFLKKSAQK